MPRSCRRSKPFACLLTMLIAVSSTACSSDRDPRIERILDGELPADNLIIYDQGVRRTMGIQVLREDGAFGPRGPTIIYVFRRLAQGDAEMLRGDGVDVEEHTAYLLPPGEPPTREAVARMQRISSVSESKTDNMLAKQFRLGEGPDPAAQAARKLPPVTDLEPASEPEPVLQPEPEPLQPAPETEPTFHATTLPLEPPMTDLERLDADIAKIDEHIRQLRSQLNALLARGVSATQRGEDTEDAEEQARLLRTQLEILVDSREDLAAIVLKEEHGADTLTPIPAVVHPVEDTCADYNAIDPGMRGPSDAFILEFAEGFAGGAIDYGICGITSFDPAAFQSHLIEYCAAHPERSPRDATQAFVCPENP